MVEERTSAPGMGGWKRRAATIWTGQAFSYVSTQTATFAVVWHVTASTGSAVALALAGLAGLLPAALLSPIGGVAADRYSRKAVVLAADGGAGLVSLAMALAFAGGAAALPLVVALLAVRAAATAFHGPALSAMMPQIVPERHLMGVNALDQMLISGSAIAGPVLGALLYSTLGIPAALFLDAACAALACSCLALARIPSHARLRATGPASVRMELGEGAACVWHDRGVRMLMLVEMAGMALLMPLANLEPLMVYSHFGGDSWAASLVEAAFGAGLLIGSGIAMALTGVRRKVPIVLGSGVAMGASLLSCGLLPQGGFAAFVVLFGLAGAGMGVYAAPVMPLVQRRIPESHLGRAMGAYSSGVLLASPVGLALAGPAAAAVGIAPWFAVCGSLMLAVHLAAFANGALRALDGEAS